MDSPITARKDCYQFYDKSYFFKRSYLMLGILYCAGLVTGISTKESNREGYMILTEKSATGRRKSVGMIGGPG